jgi:hypothetical protein
MTGAAIALGGADEIEKTKIDHAIDINKSTPVNILNR